MFHRCQPRSLLCPHRHQLRPTIDQFGHVLLGFVGQGMHLRAHALRKHGQHLGIQLVCLGGNTSCSRKVAHPLGVDHCNRNLRLAQHAHQSCFKATGGLHDHQCRMQLLELLHEQVAALVVVLQARSQPG
ncbi:hypothetical protein D3C79_880350 [compost metagenome]